MRRAGGRCSIVIACLLVAACGGEKPILNAVGSYSDVAILTSSPLLPVATTLERLLEADVEYSLRPEKMLNADIFDIRDRKDAEVYKNIIVLGLLNGTDDCSRELRKQLAGEQMKGISPRELFLATREDVYSRNQNVLFLAGHERNLMQSALGRQAAALRGQIETSNRTRLRNYLYARGENVGAQSKIADLGSFRLRVPADWNATRFFDGDSEGSIEVAATNPTRTVAIMWAPADGADILQDSEQLLELRRRWGRQFLEEELQDAGGYTWTTEIFLGEEHPMLAGFWDNETYGGPFRTIFHFEPRDQRVYGINWLCYAPEMPKHVYMREAHAIAETFQP